VYKKAWFATSPVVLALPTIWREALIPDAELNAPPKVPRSCMGPAAVVRNAWLAYTALWKMVVSRLAHDLAGAIDRVCRSVYSACRRKSHVSPRAPRSTVD